MIAILAPKLLSTGFLSILYTANVFQSAILRLAGTRTVTLKTYRLCKPFSKDLILSMVDVLQDLIGPC